MSSRAVEQPRRPVARLLTVLAVLLGLLAMHGLASTHHATAQPAASVAAAAPHEHGSAAAAAGQVSAAGQPRTAAWSLPGTSTGAPGAGTCDEHCPTDLALLCLAVLTAAAACAASLARATWSAGTYGLRQHLRVRAPTRSWPLLPRIDPVAELCVSRT